MGRNKDRRPDYPKEGKKNIWLKKDIKPIHIVLSIVAFLLLVFGFYIEIDERCKINQDPVETIATVYGKEHSVRLTYTWYKFDVDGIIYKGNTIFGSKNEIGDPIKIRYWRKDPRKNRKCR